MLRNRMLLQKPVEVPARDDAGQAVEDWLTVATVFAHIDAPRTTEVENDRGVSTRSDFRLLVSWHPSITEKCRLIFTDRGTDRIFNIRECFDRDQRRNIAEVVAVEVVP